MSSPPLARRFHRGRPHHQVHRRARTSYGRSTDWQEGEPSLEEYITEAAVGALDNRGPRPRPSTRCGSHLGELFSSQGHLGALVGSHPGLMNAIDARGGRVRIRRTRLASALTPFRQILRRCPRGASARPPCQRGRRRLPCARVALLAPARHRRLHFPALFARRIKACQEELGYTHGDLGLFAKAYKNANLSPKAQ